ncbi:hypothetical protein CANARDRAFT_24226 [[Candida] arabinofermentans NRRL YB-2248]|uniref:FHA domain-containing protein n=1 Tax=[Candida] arabinofermentans NRRL YB-2248 TaxID=983967 RepID=A0A1E4SX97_9ASCO|nr:hypothetical protein CANARDRAFT_24226 [[Candida] arabinofermentans NRRL YB-2248]
MWIIEFPVDSTTTKHHLLIPNRKYIIGRDCKSCDFHYASKRLSRQQFEISLDDSNKLHVINIGGENFTLNDHLIITKSYKTTLNHKVKSIFKLKLSKLFQFTIYFNSFNLDISYIPINIITKLSKNGIFLNDTSDFTKIDYFNVDKPNLSFRNMLELFKLNSNCKVISLMYLNKLINNLQLMHDDFVTYFPKLIKLQFDTLSETTYNKLTSLLNDQNTIEINLIDERDLSNSKYLVNLSEFENRNLNKVLCMNHFKGVVIDENTKINGIFNIDEFIKKSQKTNQIDNDDFPVLPSNSKLTSQSKLLIDDDDFEVISTQKKTLQGVTDKRTHLTDDEFEVIPSQKKIPQRDVITDKRRNSTDDEFEVIPTQRKKRTPGEVGKYSTSLMDDDDFEVISTQKKKSTPINDEVKSIPTSLIDDDFEVISTQKNKSIHTDKNTLPVTEVNDSEDGSDDQSDRLMMDQLVKSKVIKSVKPKPQNSNNNNIISLLQKAKEMRLDEDKIIQEKLNNSNQQSLVKVKKFKVNLITDYKPQPYKSVGKQSTMFENPEWSKRVNYSNFKKIGDSTSSIFDATTSVIKMKKSVYKSNDFNATMVNIKDLENFNESIPELDDQFVNNHIIRKRKHDQRTSKLFVDSQEDEEDSFNSYKADEEEQPVFRSRSKQSSYITSQHQHQHQQTPSIDVDDDDDDDMPQFRSRKRR